MRERPVAVTIFGILNLGFGVMGLGGALMSKTFESFGAMSANPNLNSVTAFMDTLNKDPGYILWMKISVPVDVAASLVLMAAGAGLLLLKNWARVASIGYAIYKMVFAFLNVAVFALALHGILGDAFQKYGAVLVAILALIGLFAVVLTLAYPVLLIFFLTRPKILPAFAPPVPGA